MSAILSENGPFPANDRRAEFACPSCLEQLDLHQPDPFEHDRLLGVCRECKDWFEVDGHGHVRGQLRLVSLRV